MRNLRQITHIRDQTTTTWTTTTTRRRRRREKKVMSKKKKQQRHPVDSILFIWLIGIFITIPPRRLLLFFPLRNRRNEFIPLYKISAWSGRAGGGKQRCERERAGCHAKCMPSRVFSSSSYPAVSSSRCCVSDAGRKCSLIPCWSSRDEMMMRA